MKITCDKEADALFITLKENGQYNVSKKVTDSFILDTDADDEILAIEILHASKHVTHPENVEYKDITRANKASD